MEHAIVNVLDGLRWSVSGIAAGTFLVAEVLLLQSTVRRRPPGRRPPRLEVVWTVLPALLLAVLVWLVLR